MIWIISGIGLVVLINLIRSDIPIKMVLKGNLKGVRRIYVNHHFKFNFKYQLFMVGLLVIGIVVISLLFYLPSDHTIALVSLCLVSYPMVALWQAQHVYHANEFEQITSFLQHFIAHFKSHSKVLLALKQSREFASGELVKLVDQAIAELNLHGDASKAFRIISNRYPHFIVVNIETWIAAAELYGVDDCKDAVELLEDDIDDWIEDTHLYVQSLHQMKVKILVLTGLSVVIALFNQNMLKSFMDLSEKVMYHNVIFIFLIIILFTILMVFRFVKESWIAKGECLWKESS
jgi:hypothetical protein